MFVVNQCGVNARAGRVIDTEVVQLLIAAEQVALFLVHHEFLQSNV